MAHETVSERFESFRATKTQLFWTSAGCAAAAVMAGFVWGGWVTGGTASELANKAERSGRAELAATICTERFIAGIDSSVKLASLKSADSWKRNEMIEKGGWVTMSGMKEPIPGAAELCVRQLMEAKSPAAKTAG